MICKKDRERLEAYSRYLSDHEKSENTIRKYIHNISLFLEFKGNQPLTRKITAAFKDYLFSQYHASTINSYITAVNLYLKWLGKENLCQKNIKCQRKFFYSNALDMEDYHKLLACAQAHEDTTYYLIMRCLAGTGIRIGELRFFTREALEAGRIEIYHKNKLRQILIPTELAGLLKIYAQEHSIQTGCVFLSHGRKNPLDASVIWRHLKRYACWSQINPDKVYPHNFRHLFARIYMNKYHNIVELADILGHSSIETTRIYTRTSTQDTLMRLNHLGL